MIVIAAIVIDNWIVKAGKHQYDLRKWPVHFNYKTMASADMYESAGAGNHNDDESSAGSKNRHTGCINYPDH